MKQGNTTKRFGIIALISAMLGGGVSMPADTSRQDLSRRRNFLLTNGGLAPIPGKMMNQRQKRKLAAQNR